MTLGSGAAQAAPFFCQMANDNIMKNILLPLIMLSVMACNQHVPESKLPNTMAGVYSLQSISYKADHLDTSFPTESQVKIFTDKHYIYGGTRPDSTTFFGFGSYFFTDSTIIEKNIFNSYALDSVSEINLKVSRSLSAYTQIQHSVLMQGLPYDVSETYKIMPGAKTSDLDGAWELVSFENITGPDTITIKNKQYKAYQGGHFMWIHRYSSDFPNKQFQSGYGFGVFNIKDKIITETITSSNYKEIIEVPISVSFSMIGNDKLLLRFNDGNSVTTETYHRVN